METPSHEITKAQTVTVEDARGRKLEFRKLKPLDRMRLFEIIGADNAMNTPYLSLSTYAFSLVKIDNEDVPTPRARVALESVVKKLDDDGMEAAAKAFLQLHPNLFADQEEAKEELKNE
jgi:hypothetical protein